MKLRLGVNIDHVATVRQARRVDYPSLIEAAQAAVRGGADQITVHLREDRRHIQDHDVIDLLKILRVPLNLEMALTDSMVAFACKYRPQWVCLVPEKREELTTEGGLNVVTLKERLKHVTQMLHGAGIKVSPFIEATRGSIEACAEAGVDAVELHTGEYANAQTPAEREHVAEAITAAAKYCVTSGLHCHGGHGLTLENVGLIAAIPEMEELNIGHSIVADALFCGFEEAVRRMKQAMLAVR